MVELSGQSNLNLLKLLNLIKILIKKIFLIPGW